MKEASQPRLPDPGDSHRGASSGMDGLPAHAPQTYYDQPMLKKPHWEWEVITYLFMGGVMGGSGILVALADDREDRDADLARTARYLAFALAATCPIVLVKHLGRPERFLHMMRIFKLKSVMSMGVWGLVAFSAPAALGALGQASRDGIVPSWMRHLAPRAITNPLTALFGAFITGYTGVLISATAIPIWAIGKRHIPAISVCSGLAGACAANVALLALTGGSTRTQRKLERFELAIAATELVLLESYRRHAGATGDPMFAGERGKKLRTYTQIGGLVVPALLNLLPIHGRAKTVLASALTLVGGYVLRETFIESGKDSADDPKVASRQPE